ncbi:PiggyBac transposable element-derived protein 3 [Trichinella nativa]|uniref:PiggyBac transposable element-derived protein 3 n=1 Tax=Trichinella nativa TaxID=6335 RepID=A0A0V1KXN7_9BILA|nr:PiggyBac transposable element-derived protein 3 [Trichinella nativa]
MGWLQSLEHWHLAYVKELTQKGIKTTGTVRNARIRDCPLMKPETIMKKCRGYFEHASDGKCICVDKMTTAVTIASNYYTHFPVGTVKRFSRAVKKHVDVAEPNILRQYN